jgi:hypothetical protein
MTMEIRMTAYRLPLALSFLVVVAGSLQTTVRAEIRVAAALTPEAVWDANDAANDADVVWLPAGTAVWKRGMELRALGEDESDAEHGAAPVGQSRARSETGRARQGTTGFLQREARSRVLQAVRLPSSAARGLGRIREECRCLDQQGPRKYLDAETCRQMLLCQPKHWGPDR